VVPEGSWFCHTCEREVQVASLGGRQSASQLVAAALEVPEGRSVLLRDPQYFRLLEGLRSNAHKEVR
jgi:hypothetical protein